MFIGLLKTLKLLVLLASKAILAGDLSTLFVLTSKKQLYSLKPKQPFVLNPKATFPPKRLAVLSLKQLCVAISMNLRCY